MSDYIEYKLQIIKIPLLILFIKFMLIWFKSISFISYLSF